MSTRMRRQAPTATAVHVVTLVTLVTLSSLLAACGTGNGSTRPASRPSPDRDGSTSVSTVTAQDVATMRVGRIEEVLMGRVPGLTVHRTANGDYTMRIRGTTSFLGNDEPLIVIDGMPIMSGASSRALASIDPSDVARVDVLKDAGALAIWGSRGGNGVILITTRRGR